MSDEEYTDADEEESTNSFIGLLRIMLVVLVVGIVIGAIIFSLVTLKTELLKIDVEFSDTAQYGNMQEIFAVYLYPIFDITGFLVTLCHIYIILLVIGFFIMSYKVGTKPVYLGLSVLFLILSVFLAVIVSNYYIDLISNEVVSDLVSDLTYYNFFMINLPWFVFIIGLAGILISLINFQHPATNQLNEGDLY